MKLADRTHYGLAVSCAQRFRERGVPMEELIGEAEAALLWAASRFDESRGVRFSTYAVPVVLGALRDLCRRAQPMYVPRAEGRMLARADAARERFCRLHGREPAISELAQALSIAPDSLGQMLCARERMQYARGDADLSLVPADGDVEEAVLCRDLIRSLPRPFAQVLWLRCALGMSQAEVARRLGVGQPQVSRWERQGKAQLRQSLADG